MEKAFFSIARVEPRISIGKLNLILAQEASNIFRQDRQSLSIEIQRQT